MRTPSLAAPAVLAALLAACGGGSDPAPPPPPPPPGVLSVKPPTGDAAGGFAVVVRGADFVEGATVTFGGAAAAVTTFSAGALTVLAPPHATGPVDVTVTNPDGQSAGLPGAFTYWPTAPLPEASALAGLATFPQAQPLDAGLEGPFPGLSTVWTARRDLSLQDWSSAFAQLAAFSEAATLALGTPAAWDPDTLLTDPGLSWALSADPGQAQAFADLSFSTPLSDPADPPPAVVVDANGFDFAACPAGNGPPCAAIVGSLVKEGALVRGTRLEQTVDLTGLTTGDDVYVAFRYNAWVRGNGGLAGAPGPAFGVVLRDAAGAPVWSIEITATDGSPSGAWQGLLPPFVPAAPVTLAIELRGAADSWALVDDVSLVTGGMERLANGGFDAGLSGWTATTAPAAPSRVTGAPRTVALPDGSGSLSVTRSIYAPPGEAWIRVVDLFRSLEAHGTLTTDAVYAFGLGAVTEGVIFSDPPGTGGKAFSAWDATGGAVDLAVVHGATTAYGRSATWAAGGAEFVFTRQPLALGPGEQAAVVHFLVLGSGLTGPAADEAAYAARPAGVDAAAADILAGWATTPDYRAYLSAEERAAVVNF